MSNQERDDYDEPLTGGEPPYPISYTSAGIVCLVMGLASMLVGGVFLVEMVSSLFGLCFLVLFVFILPLEVWLAILGYELIVGTVKHLTGAPVILFISSMSVAFLAVIIFSNTTNLPLVWSRDKVGILLGAGLIIISISFAIVAFLMTKGHEEFLLWKERQNLKSANRETP